jgi:hypothetical protein
MLALHGRRRWAELRFLRPAQEESAMDTASLLTLRLAEGFGLYLMAIGAGAIIAPDRWHAVGEEMEHSRALVLIAGILTFAFGALIFGIHHSLTDPFAILITFLAALGAVEGVLLLVVPQTLIAIGRSVFARPQPWGIAAVVLGAALFVAGLTGHATAAV